MNTNVNYGLKQLASSVTAMLSGFKTPLEN